MQRFLKRAKKKGWVRAADQFSYCILYRRSLQASEAAKLRRAVAAFPCRPRQALAEIPQVLVTDIYSRGVAGEVQTADLEIWT